MFNEKFAFEDDLRRLRKKLRHFGPDSKFTPNISRLFANYLHHAIVQYIRQITENLDIKKMKKLVEQIKEIFDDSIMWFEHMYLKEEEKK